MAWIEFHLELRDHWKIDRVSESLKVDYTQALGMIACLWCWAGGQAKDGDLSKFKSHEISKAARWKGDPDVLKNVLESAELVDKDGKIHDWGQHGLRILNTARSRIKKFRKHTKNSNVTVTLPETLQFAPPSSLPSFSPSFSLSNNISGEKSPQPNSSKQKRTSRPKKYTSEEFNHAKEFILKNWKLASGPYEFQKLDYGILGQLLNYGLPRTLALLDLFWQTCPDWTRDHVGRNLKGLMHEKLKLLDNPRLKILIEKYSGPIRTDIPVGIKSMPAEPNHQTAKVEACRKVEALRGQV